METKPSREPMIPVLMEELDKSTNELAEKVSTLYVRLRPVIRQLPEPERNENKAPMVHHDVVIADYLIHQMALVNETLADVQEILDTLEI